ncbi:hypothetical protein CLOSTASPAR_02001 [[Clostridium] asparagiforme DSM 15981]|uniref:Uncharacterized protein n=1 Tax=[Clostridium] asparagiforme DSM 15981 TaxID=518636 RepID=C0CYC5_9FIRM|nr:hypothetical protein CLOSTASPAR_02001 [[Clostridium] asparagiforme DSM 15981]
MGRRAEWPTAFADLFKHWPQSQRQLYIFKSLFSFHMVYQTVKWIPSHFAGIHLTVCMLRFILFTRHAACFLLAALHRLQWAASATGTAGLPRISQNLFTYHMVY